MSTRPSQTSRPSSHATASAKVRWISSPITRLTTSSSSLGKTGAWGDTTPTDPRSRRNRASRRGGQLLTRARSSSYTSACPHFVLPVPLSRMVAPYAGTASIPAERRHQHPHTGYEPARAPQRRDQAPHRGRRDLPQRGRHHPARRRDPAGAKRRMGRSASPLHHSGNDRSNER